jgi:site-specific recombinase XerD
MSYRKKGSGPLEDRLVVRYLEFVESRARLNTLRAVKSDLGIFLSFVDKEPAAVTTDDVLRFVADQRTPRFEGRVVRLADGEAGLRASTIKRRLSSVAGFYSFLVMVEEVDRNPVPTGMATRRPRRHRRSRVPLVRAPRLLPKILEPVEVNALFAALRRIRDRAMVEAMVLGGLRRCEVLGLRLGDLRPAERRVLVADGKGGHQRMVSISPRFFRSVSLYMQTERSENTVTDRLFVVLKGPRRGEPLSEDGLEEIIRAAKARAGLAHATCHELRHTCFTRLREAGMALEAIQAQAGHRSIETTRLYLHLSNDWLADEYQRAAELIDVSVLEVMAR